MNEWSWNVREYRDYWRELVGEEHADIKYIFFTSDGEPLLHPLDFFPQTEIRKKVLQRYFTTHYSEHSSLLYLLFLADYCL